MGKLYVAEFPICTHCHNQGHWVKQCLLKIYQEAGIEV